jgi:hypothetical protein
MSSKVIFGVFFIIGAGLVAFLQNGNTIKAETKHIVDCESIAIACEMDPTSMQCRSSQYCSNDMYDEYVNPILDES